MMLYRVQDEKQDRQVLDVSHNINYIDVDQSKISNFVIHTIALGPNHPIFTTFNPLRLNYSNVHLSIK